VIIKVNSFYFSRVKHPVIATNNIHSYGGPENAIIIEFSEHFMITFYGGQTASDAIIIVTQSTAFPWWTTKCHGWLAQKINWPSDILKENMAVYTVIYKLQRQLAAILHNIAKLSIFSLSFPLKKEYSWI